MVRLSFFWSWATAGIDQLDARSHERKKKRNWRNHLTGDTSHHPPSPVAICVLSHVLNEEFQAKCWNLPHVSQGWWWSRGDESLVIQAEASLEKQSLYPLPQTLACSKLSWENLTSVDELWALSSQQNLDLPSFHSLHWHYLGPQPPNCTLQFF